jgi:predicted Zn-ribbon and HTH transcriptional regulator
MGMYRKDLIGFLFHNPMRVAEIAKLYGVSLQEAEDDLQHLRRTLKKSAYRVQVHPAACRKCAFVFSGEKLTKPGKCPRCRGTWIEEPLVEITTT